MPKLFQASLPLYEAKNLEAHIGAYLTDAGYRERFAGTEPTPHLPGTWDKVEVLARRLEAGQPLWHPGDAKPKRKPNLAALEALIAG